VSEDQELTPEDQALLAALAALETGQGAPSSPRPAPGHALPPAPSQALPLPEGAAAAAAETETLTRLHLETLGLVPFALPPIQPRPEVRRRLLDLVAGGGTEVPVLAPPRPGATLERPPEPALPFHPAKPAEPAEPAKAAKAAKAGNWLLALAAALILALLATCGWLVSGLREQETVAARLADQRNVALRQAADAQARLGRLSSQVSSMRDSLAVVTSPAAEVCNLRAATPEMGNARGILFVAADHQHWTMSLRGLRPSGDGKVYQLWFVAEQGMVSGGTFGVGARLGGPTELGSEHMPAGTKGVMITLEDSPGSPAPRGPEMLRNADTLHTL
jgi:hypothetical protein